MSYRQNAAANRDALFGSAGGGSSKPKKKSTSKSSATNTSKAPASSVPTSQGYQYKPPEKKSSGGRSRKPKLSGEAREAKLQEAKSFKDQAKKAMQRGMFSKPDPLAASTFYKRAADCYQLCGGDADIEERTCRMSSADCQMRVGAFATAAADYTRAAELTQEGTGDEPMDRKREIGRQLHLKAAEAWTQLNEPSKAASSRIQAALCLIWGEEATLLPRLALEAMEEAIEAHVPDPLNPYARYRQTGISAYIDPESEETVAKPSAKTMELARQHIVTRAYAHEPVQEVVYMLVSYGEYASALYAAGAVSAILAEDNISTLTLSRVFVQETILSLALGDPIGAEQEFLNRHVQKSSYLQSRECKLAEDLFRACKMRDGDALEEARSPSGSNRAALNNLHESMKELVQWIRLTGVARRGVSDNYASATSNDGEDDKKKKTSGRKGAKPVKAEPTSSLAELAAKKTGYEVDHAAAEAINQDDLMDELDALDFGDGSDEDDLSDDGIDLR